MKIPVIQLTDKLPMFSQSPRSFTKFLIEKTGEHFYYSNYTNGIYDEQMTPISKEVVPDDIYFEAVSHTRTLSKSKSPSWIRVLLGHACNYSCDYCLQKDIGNPEERAKITTTEKFIDQLSTLDLTKVTKIDLWGGETLLYWKTIVPIMQAFDRPGLKWYIPTNGTPLMMKHAEFFSTLQGTVEIGISHDGPAHTLLRGPEFLHKKVEVLKAFQTSKNIRFSFNPTISNTNFDFFKINKFFYNFCIDNGLDPTKTGLGYTILYNHDYENTHNSANHVIQGTQLIEFRKVMKEYMRANTRQFLFGESLNLLKNDLYTGGMGVLPYAQTLKEQVLPTVTTTCGVDDEDVLSVDIAGNVRTCPHVDESFISGTVEEIENVRIKNVVLDRYETHCDTCPVYRLCKSTCPIDVPKDVFYSNCAISKIWYGGIQEEAFRISFNSEIRNISDDVASD